MVWTKEKKREKRMNHAIAQGRRVYTTQERRADEEKAKLQQGLADKATQTDNRPELFKKKKEVISSIFAMNS